MGADRFEGAKLVLSLVFGGILWLFIQLYKVFFVKPQKLASRLRNQGIRGPSPSFLLGNIPEIKRIQLQVQTKSSAAPKTSQNENQPVIDHDWPSTVFPHLHQWLTEYGPTFLYSTGNIQLLCTTDVEILKEIGLCTSPNLGKPAYLSKDRGPLLGQSILSTSGSVWAHQRKIIAPELFIDKVKGMISLMTECTMSMERSWGSRIESEGGTAVIDVAPDMRRLSADIISRACFGSNYARGEEIFVKLKSLQDVMSKASIGIPGLRYDLDKKFHIIESPTCGFLNRHFPTKQNREIWKLEREINSLILNVVKQRADANHENDLLQMILEGAKRDDEGLTSRVNLNKFIVDNCKAIYFAGHETTAITASWCLMLLAAHPDWQARVRTELLEICQDQLPQFDMLRNMKVLTMVIQETMRLYPATAYLIRSAEHDIKFKDVVVPKGVDIQIPIPIVQQDPAVWGPDAHQFNPERFANGVLGACKSPQAYFPFGVGARICAGQHLAMAELKIILSCLLPKFSFSLSPAYRHAPILGIVVHPRHGVHLCITPIS
ncbi:hypothetical protein Tsubulata_002749 [Turnera subulata]|uniref:Cytochrome P450 n=1 Tax=Turnera subulata TaxID=218843 RepID=A0A9Q0JNR8_9ROSI|nr:hypothetical protein Tsubulata_002749 [Turnera subulata]